MILVTGATGRTGSEVVKALITKGEQVRALVRDPERAESIQGPGVELVVGDVEKPDASAINFSDCTRVPSRSNMTARITVHLPCLISWYFSGYRIWSAPSELP